MSDQETQQPGIPMDHVLEEHNAQNPRLRECAVSEEGWTMDDGFLFAPFGPIPGTRTGISLEGLRALLAKQGLRIVEGTP